MKMTDVKIVVGANYGDEGKGLVTDYFCHQATSIGHSCINVLSNGGAQRGHTVDTKTEHHVFKHFGSGTFAGADTYFPEQFILNPMQFKKEYDEITPTTNFYYNVNCRWTTPYDIIANQIIESARDNKRHGSCGMGIWETVLRYQKMTSPRIIDFILMPTEKQLEYLSTVRAYFIDRFADENILDLPNEWKHIWKSPELVYHFIEDVKFFVSKCKVSTDSNIFNYDTAVFENGQGLLLTSDANNNNTTPTNTTSYNALRMCKGKDVDVEVCYVSRTYLTRHGAGQFEEECSKELLTNTTDETNLTNEFQGYLRYGELDVNKLVRRIKGDYKGVKQSLILTHTNELAINTTPIIDSGLTLYTSDTKFRDSIKKENE